MAGSSTQQHYTLVDGLRGVAALAVVLYHYMHFAMTGTDHDRYVEYLSLQPFRTVLGPFYVDGHYAVQLFWLISGFVFAAVYFGRNTTTRGFAANRFARLYPLHLLTLLIVAALQAAALAKLGHSLLYDNFDWRHFALQLFFASDWLEGQGHSFNGPIWSVSIEVVVYALFWFLREPLRRAGPVGLLGAIGLCLMASALGTVTRIPVCAFYFFSGVALLRLHEWLGSRWRLPVVLGFAVIGGVGLAQDNAMLREVAGLTGLFAAVLLALASIENWTSAGLRRASGWLGDCTYGIYLWHVPLQLALMLVLLPAVNPAILASKAWFLPLWLGAVIGTARLSFVWIERPAREALRRLGTPRGKGQAAWAG